MRYCIVYECEYFFIQEGYQNQIMFKNNSYSVQACNYSFRDDEADKQNHSSAANCSKKDTGIMAKLQAIQKMMNRQYEIEMENRKMLKQQAESISQIEKQIIKINKFIGNSNEGVKNSRFKSESMKSCRTKRSIDKSVLNCIEERKKVINQQLTRRISDQLESKPQKKPLRFFMPEQSIL